MEQFILHNEGGKEPGIIIVQNTDSLIQTVDFLVGSGFLVAHTIPELISHIDHGGRVTISQDEINSDPVSYFDIMYGFASGSLDKDTIHMNPEYKKLNVILVASSEFLESESETGRDWLSLCGLAFQYSAK